MTRDATPLQAVDSQHEELPLAPVAEEKPAENSTARLRRIVDTHYDLVWRTVRFLGVADANAEDVALQVLYIAARKLGDIAPGAERSFLLATAWRVASENRRAVRRQPQPSDADVDVLEAPLPSAEDLLDQKRARAVLQSVLNAMPPDLRIVFVLVEIEELSLPEIATATGVPLGTVTSRLRRARELFQNIVRRRNKAAQSAVRRGDK